MCRLTDLGEKETQEGDERFVCSHQLLNLLLVSLSVVALGHQFRELIKTPVNKHTSMKIMLSKYYS